MEINKDYINYDKKLCKVLDYEIRGMDLDNVQMLLRKWN